MSKVSWRNLNNLPSESLTKEQIATIRNRMKIVEDKMREDVTKVLFEGISLQQMQELLANDTLDEK